MPIQVLVSDPVSEEGLAPLRQDARFNVVYKPGLKGPDFLKEVAVAEALLVRSETKVTADVIAAAPKLRFIGRAGTGVDNIDLAAASRQGIVVANVPGGNTISAAEQSLALLFALARNTPQADASTHAGKWERAKFVGQEITGKTLGVVGLGRIGREVATRGMGLQMRVVAFDPMGDESWCRRAGVEFVPLDRLLAEADFITLHVPLSEQTKGLINEKTLAKTKKGVRVINCARGGIVDEKALLAFVEKGHVKGAALDVFEKEPLDPASPLLKRPEIILTPHLGASTEEAQVKVAAELAQGMVEFFINGFARQAVNLPPLDVAGQAQLLAFVGLAYKQGLFLAQMSEGTPRRFSIAYSGELGRVNPALYTATAVAGFLTGLGEAATPVNALALAQKRGLQIQEQVATEARDYASLLEMEAATDNTQHQIAGTVYGRGDLRFVRIDGLPVDVNPQGHLMVLCNEDRPGVVGHTGTVLAEGGVNIAGMDIARNRPGGTAVSLWSVDSDVPAAVLAKVKSHAAVLSIKMVNL